MRPGQLDRQVTFQKKQATQDQVYGTDVVEWVPVLFKVNKLHFDEKINGHVQSINKIIIGAAYTFEGWVNLQHNLEFGPDLIANFFLLSDFGAINYASGDIYFGAAPQLYFSRHYDATPAYVGYPADPGASNLLSNVDYHIIYTYDGTTGKIYLDGALDVTGAQVVTGTIENWFTVGEVWTGAFRTGEMYGIRVYDRAISPTEAAEHYAGVFNNDANLLIRWDFDEGAGIVATDKSGHGNNGTITGGRLVATATVASENPASWTLEFGATLISTTELDPDGGNTAAMFSLPNAGAAGIGSQVEIGAYGLFDWTLIGDGGASVWLKADVAGDICLTDSTGTYSVVIAVTTEWQRFQTGIYLLPTSVWDGFYRVAGSAVANISVWHPMREPASILDNKVAAEYVDSTAYIAKHYTYNGNTVDAFHVVTAGVGATISPPTWVQRKGSKALGVAERFCVQIVDSLPSRSEMQQQQLVVSKNQSVLRMRYRDDIDSSMRILLHGDGEDVIYQIIGGPAMIGRKEWLEMTIEKYSA
jgi:head-tail adaptor